MPLKQNLVLKLFVPLFLGVACASEPPPKDPKAESPYWCYDHMLLPCYASQKQCVKEHHDDVCKHQDGAACISAMVVVKGKRSTWCMATMSACQSHERAIVDHPDFAEVGTCEVRR
jgi:hypothetical protein